MSFISPLDVDLAVAYLPMMPVGCSICFAIGGVALVEVPDQEFDSMGPNVLALGPRIALALEGNPADPATHGGGGGGRAVLPRRRDLPQGRRWAHLPHAAARARLTDPLQPRTSGTGPPLRHGYRRRWR